MTAVHIPKWPAPVAKRASGHVLPQSPLIDISKPGRLRTAHVLALFAISHSTLHVRMRAGAFPAPDGKDGGRNFWNTSTILQHLESSAKVGAYVP